MICDKCHNDLPIEEHHLWPKFMNNPHGNVRGNFPSRIWLCKDCHTGEEGIHSKVILPLLKKASTKPELNSEYSLWSKIPFEDLNVTIDLCIFYSDGWLK